MTNHPNRKKLTQAEALSRALSALQTAVDKSNNFDHGGMPSNEIYDCVRDYLRAEFGAMTAAEANDKHEVDRSKEYGGPADGPNYA